MWMNDDHGKDPPDDPDEDEHDQDLELKGVDSPPVVGELHEESVVLLEPLRVGERRGCLNKNMCYQFISMLSMSH